MSGLNTLLEEKAFPQLVPGQQIDQYILEEQIGSGGMGVVFAAKQVHMDRRVAIKFLPDVDNNPESVRRFEREVRMISTLEHPHILPVYAYGEAFGAPYIVMRYMPGGTLTDQVNKGALNLRVALKIIDQVAGGLDYAHDQTIIHRDIKPSNIFLDERYYAYLADFGLAKTMTGEHDLTRTEDGISGTPDYMSPEQVRGLKLDARADIYSLGIIGFQLLSSRLPYVGKGPMDTVMMQINSAIPSIHQLVPLFPIEIDDIFRRVLAKKVTDRYENAKAFSEDLTYILRDVDQSISLEALANSKPSVLESVPTEVNVDFQPDLLQETRPNRVVTGATKIGQPVIPDQATQPSQPVTVDPKQGSRNLLAPFLIIATLMTAAVLGWLGYEIYTNPFRNLQAEFHPLEISPFDLILDRDNRLWVAGINQQQVQALTGECKLAISACGQIVSTNDVDSRPHRLVLRDDGRVIVGHQLNAGLKVIGADGFLETIDVKEIPTDFTIDGSTIWMTSANELLEVDPSGEVLTRLEIGALPRAVAILGSTLWVAVEGDGRLKAVDIPSKMEVPNKEVLLTQSADRFIPLLADPAENRLFAALNKDNLVFEIDGTTATEIRQYSTTDRPVEMWLAFEKLWVLTESSLDIFDTADGRRLDHLPLSGRPSSAEMIVCGPSCAELWVAFESTSELAYYDLSDSLDNLDRFTILP